MINLVLRVRSQTATKIVLEWDPVAGAQGFAFYRDGARVSYTMDGSRTSVAFAFSSTAKYTVLALVAGPSGTYPSSPAPAGVPMPYPMGDNQ